jgi:HEAT repeat protein
LTLAAGESTEGGADAARAAAATAAVSEQVVRVLGQQLLREEKPQVREVLAAAIGTIGLPEGLPCVEALIQNISRNEEDPNVKAMSVWSLGRLATYSTGQKAKKVITAALKDSYWKVRAAACTAVA